MNARLSTKIAAANTCTIRGAAVAAIALFVVVAYSQQPGVVGSATANGDAKSATDAKATKVEQGATNSTTATNEAAEAQQKAADTLGIPVEKTLAKSGIVLRLIPAGTFEMGSPKSEQDHIVDSVTVAIAGCREAARAIVDQETQHTVTLTKAFYLGKYEVTQGQWNKVMGSTPWKLKHAGSNAPVECVSWHDCTNFMKRLAALEGMPEGAFRLPTEAEWEYACRAGTKTTFSYGTGFDSSMANFDGNFPYPNGSGKKSEYRDTAVPVGLFQPNAWGLYDMHGNVWEWCLDWYRPYTGDATDPAGAAVGSCRVMRGGGWCFSANYCRSAYRGYNAPGHAYNDLGFRLYMSAGK